MNRKTIIKLLIFIGILLCGLARLNTIFTLKEYPSGENVNILINPYELCEKQDGFYELEENTLDVIFVGSSNIHCNINPNLIWHETGITSYDFSCDMQELGTSYYYLKQAFETQSPKVAFIDVKYIGDRSIENIQAHYAFDHMKMDSNRIAAILNRTDEDRLEIMFPMIAYHDRWKELTKNDLLYKRNQHNPLKGSFIYMLAKKYEEPEWPIYDFENHLSKEEYNWIDKVYSLCKDNECECIFIKTPLSDFGIDGGAAIYLDSFEKYCVEKGYSFMYMNKMLDLLDIDFATDYVDDSHMNFSGQKHLAEYFVSYLLNNYNFIDKRKDYNFQLWNDDYDVMMYYVDNYDI